MYASKGDRLVIHSQHVDGPVRDGEILDARGPEGSPPFVVRWSDTGHESLSSQVRDASVEHFHHERKP